MKITRIKTAALLTAVTMLLSGCGDVPYELTETEEGIITNYAAHVVTKFNTDQKQGLTYVNRNAMEETEVSEEIVQTEETETPDESLMGAGSGSASETAQTQNAGAAGLDDLFGMEGLSVRYAGAELMESYVEDTYYAVDADAGKTYLVLKFDLINNGTKDAEIDMLAKGSDFRVSLADGTSVKAELTVLLEDFSTYQGTVSAGDTQQTVLLFQILDTVTEVPEFTLDAIISGASYQIVL